ncbi:Histone-lysine N-methyltransferase- H3 lysine-9 specific SUVH5 [Striga hermonthica]|uniref:Histone-lysine N-methyltransferase- H3 lysine-9 specific SUVH5 n=1 Tax=Striga hermonthica TaxID=68872 RepID=A0A9N7NS06_STRHE|nr:Histone-lysine N-methyltransferase- H3 lysine-9 specific SUVH5 [Striga hermonthica]
MPAQRLPKNENYKLRKLNAARTTPPKTRAKAQSDSCGLPSTDSVSSSTNNNVKCSKLEFTNEINERESEMPVKGAKNVSAVPLKSLPPVNVICDPKSSVRRGKKRTKESGNEARSQRELWKHNSKKLAALLSEAKSYLDAFDVKFSNPSYNLRKRTSTGENNVQENLDANQTNSENYEDEVCILSHEEWTKLQSCLSGKSNGVKGMKSGQQRKDDTDIEPTVTKGGEKNHVLGLTDSDNCASLKSNNDPRFYDHNRKDLINLSIVKHEEPEGVKVMKALRLFEKYYNKSAKEQKTAYNHLEAADRLKREGKYLLHEKPFGHIPGVEIGDEFRFRSQLAVIGLHRQLIGGIDHVTVDGKKYAVSVVDSGRYDNTSKTPDVLVYTGQGGNPKIVDNSSDQKLERGNLALMNSMSARYPVRVTHKRKSREGPYVYEGLYTINNVWQEKDNRTSNLVFKFELHRMPEQLSSEKVERRVCISNDISLGKEKMPIRVVNEVDDQEPPTFVYITRMVYPEWYERIEPSGCACLNGCSDSRPCPCVVKNGGEIPYNEKGAILRRKARIYECGPLCGCPPACMNRVGQQKLRYELEIFKTERRGWGVRSRELIPSGGFVCEYLGELLRDKDADLRVGHDEYLFDIYNSRGRRVDGYAIDGAVYGNVGRFINHSCSPNVYAQDVCYDHTDKRIPHIMFFATRDIPPWEELAYDYNYKPDTVRDANGNIKTKDCFCGSRQCRGRLY